MDRLERGRKGGESSGENREASLPCKNVVPSNIQATTGPGLESWALERCSAQGGTFKGSGWTLETEASLTFLSSAVPDRDLRGLSPSPSPRPSGQPACVALLPSPPPASSCRHPALAPRLLLGALVELTRLVCIHLCGAPSTSVDGVNSCGSWGTERVDRGRGWESLGHTPCR